MIRKRICHCCGHRGFRRLSFPCLQGLRNTSQVGNQPLALGTLAQMNLHGGSPSGCDFAIEVRHEFFGFDGMGMRDLVHMASPSARVSFTLSAASRVAEASALFGSGIRYPFNDMRDRNSRERTVFTGSFNNSAISI